MTDTERYVTTRPPSPPLPGFVQMIAWGVRPVEVVSALARRYGDAFTVRFVQGRGITYVNRPEAVRDLAGLDPAAYRAGEEAREILEPFLGPNSLLVLDGEEHTRHRQWVARAFHAGSFAAHEQTMLDAAQRAMRELPLGIPVRMHEPMQALTLDIILRVVFGVGDTDLDALLPPVREMLQLANSLSILYEPLRKLPRVRTTWSRFCELRTQIDEEVVDLIRLRRRAPDLDERVDICSALARARDDDGMPLDEAIVRDHLLTMLFAGHDTTATALAWAFDLLAHNPPVAERLASELAGDDDVYLDALIKEVLRMRPIVPEIVRRIVEPTRIGGTLLPAGTTVGVSAHLLQHRPDIYPEPAVFRPDRFVEQQVEMHAWIPFGLGARRCLGAAFATLELRSVLRTIVPARRVAPVLARPERARRRVTTLVPRHGAPVVLIARE